MVGFSQGRRLRNPVLDGVMKMGTYGKLTSTGLVFDVSSLPDLRYEAGSMFLTFAGAIKQKIGTGEVAMRVPVNPVDDNAYDLGAASAKWRTVMGYKGDFTNLGVRVRRDAGDYGGNFATYTPPTGEEGLIIIAQDTNAASPARRIYVYSGGAWRYVALT